MKTQQSRENEKVVERQIGWKAKRELIRSIQEMQGGPPCFQSGKENCVRYDCGWRADCKPGSD